MGKLRNTSRLSRLGIAAVLAGATGIGFAPILVRWSQVGPSATASLRILMAIPILWIMLWLESRRDGRSLQPARRSDFLMLAIAGLFFSADLSIWHWSLQFTSVANSTLLTNFAPIFVTLGARMFLGERISTAFLVGMAVAIGGAVMLVKQSFRISPGDLLGDGLAMAGAVFYAGYLLTVKSLRRSLSTVAIMAWSALVSGPVLLLVGVISGEKLLPVDARGWGVLLALALVSHVGGQTLIAYALGHLPASFSALSLLWQPVMAAILAWVALDERLRFWQIAGGMLVLVGILIASRWSGADKPET